jgi:hypothetical protein
MRFSEYGDDALLHELQAKRDWLRTNADVPRWRQRETEKQIRAIEDEIEGRGLEVAVPNVPQSKAEPYYEACLRWQRSEAFGELGPAGWEYGLDRADANEIAQRAYDDHRASGGTPRSIWKPSAEHDEERLIQAYRSRRLRA